MEAASADAGSVDAVDVHSAATAAERTRRARRERRRRCESALRLLLARLVERSGVVVVEVAAAPKCGRQRLIKSSCVPSSSSTALELRVQARNLLLMRLDALLELAGLAVFFF